MEQVVTESDLLALSFRIRTAKADLKEAIRIRDIADADYKRALNDVQAAWKRFHEARGALMEVAGGLDDISTMWS